MELRGTSWQSRGGIGFRINMKNLNILGISFLPESSVTVLRNGSVVAAVSEERLNRVKLSHGFPKLAVNTALKLADLTIDDIDVIATHGAAPSAPEEKPFLDKENAILNSDLPKEVREAQIANIRQRLEHERMVLGKRTPQYLAEIQTLGKPVRIYGHHECHAATAFYGSGWDDCFVLTADGWGEDGSSTLRRCRNGKMELISKSFTFDSLGYFYGSITKALGFIPHRHEGKVLGLAAFCKEPKSYKTVRSMVDFDADQNRFLGRMDRGIYLPRFENPYLKELALQYTREDMAASAQQTLEEVVCACVSQLAQSQGGSKIRLALAGGVFANVKLNQRLLELPQVSDIFIFPNMGDGGLSVGAAWLAHQAITGRSPAPWRNCYLGPSYSDDEIAGEINQFNLQYEHLNNIAETVGTLLAGGQIVARFDGPMEFGPRALGNRSILVQATDPTVNNWLNQRLNRSEFMPFAPATLAQYADDCYVGLDGGREAAKYMTMTFSCTDRMKAQSGAAVHVDGTARPQLVSQQTNKQFYDILMAYHSKTGIPSLVNTSFNMHEEPIVCTVNDALRSILDGKLPYLAVGNFLVKNNKI